jgi:hypothetical protein
MSADRRDPHSDPKIASLRIEARACALEFFAAELRHQAALDLRRRGPRLEALEGKRDRAEAAVETARRQWADAIGVTPEELPE